MLRNRSGQVASLVLVVVAVVAEVLCVAQHPMMFAVIP
jgi:hypothetical protein